MDSMKDRRHAEQIQEIQLTGTSKCKKKMMRKKVIKGDNFRV